jgi:hypothetical protein
MRHKNALRPGNQSACLGSFENVRTTVTKRSNLYKCHFQFQWSVLVTLRLQHCDQWRCQDSTARKTFLRIFQLIKKHVSSPLPLHRQRRNLGLQVAHVRLLFR